MEAWPSVAPEDLCSIDLTHVKELKFRISSNCAALQASTSYRREVLSRARERASRLTEIAVSGLPEAAEEALATTDACVEGAQ